MDIINYLYFQLIQKPKIKNNLNIIRVPAILNILGETHHLETSFLSPEYVYIKIYEEDFELIPDRNSKIILFISLNFYSHGKLELMGKIIDKEDLKGGRCGLWLQFTEIGKDDKSFLQEFITQYYSPRYSVRFKVLIEPYNSIHSIETEAINLSENGLFLETDFTTLQPGSLCMLHLNTGNGYIPLHSQISWVNDGKLYDRPNGYGVKFLHNKSSLSEIRNYIGSLKNKSEVLR